jgi:two-component system NtrC family response regulator
MEEGDNIEPDHIGFLTFPYHTSQRQEDLSIKIPPEGLNLDELTRQLIIQALELSGSNRTRAAQLLGISRPTLTYRIEKHGIKL